MMSDILHNFPTQFLYQPVLENAGYFPKKKHVIVIGMGGSHLPADLLLAYNPAYPMVTRRDYGLPPLADKRLKESLIVALSYSGNTEEVIDAYTQARRKKLAVVVIAIGGELLRLAKKDGVPYIQMPDMKIQPRAALGLSFRALLKALGEEKVLRQTNRLAKVLDSNKIAKQGKAVARALTDHVPVVYCSQSHETIAWNWKIKLNETGKIPAYYNVLPEMNHNEMNGFDVTERSAHLSKVFHFILLHDRTDHPQIQKRMSVLATLYKKRKLPVTQIELTGKDYFEKVFSSLLLADWTAVYTAEHYGLESEQVPMIEEFKRLLVR